MIGHPGVGGTSKSQVPTPRHVYMDACTRSNTRHTGERTPQSSEPRRRHSNCHITRTTHTDHQRDRVPLSEPPERAYQVDCAASVTPSRTLALHYKSRALPTIYAYEDAPENRCAAKAFHLPMDRAAGRTAADSAVFHRSAVSKTAGVVTCLRRGL